MKIEILAFCHQSTDYESHDNDYFYIQGKLMQNKASLEN
jgi:hypothetical protein